MQLHLPRVCPGVDQIAVASTLPGTLFYDALKYIHSDNRSNRPPPVDAVTLGKMSVSERMGLSVASNCAVAAHAVASAAAERAIKWADENIHDEIVGILSQQGEVSL
jgi:hypothetical protein